MKVDLKTAENLLAGLGISVPLELLSRLDIKECWISLYRYVCYATELAAQAA